MDVVDRKTRVKPVIEDCPCATQVRNCNWTVDIQLQVLQRGGLRWISFASKTLINYYLQHY